MSDTYESMLYMSWDQFFMGNPMVMTSWLYDPFLMTQRIILKRDAMEPLDLNQMLSNAPKFIFLYEILWSNQTLLKIC